MKHFYILLILVCANSVAQPISGQPTGPSTTPYPTDPVWTMLDYWNLLNYASINNPLPGNPNQPIMTWGVDGFFSAANSLNHYLADYTPKTRTLTINGTPLDLSANRSWTLSTAITSIPNVTVSQTAIVALLGGVRKVTITGITGLLAGDRVVLTPIGSTPVGYALADVYVPSNGTMEVSFTAPALALGGSFSIPCKVTAFR